MKKAKIFIVDDHPVTIRGLKFLIESEKKLEVCGMTTEVVSALEKIKNSQPDLVIVDIVLGACCGLELTQNIVAKFSKLPVLIYSLHEEALFAEKALQVGAKGFLSKMEPEENIFIAIDKVLSGGIYIRDEIKDHFMALQWGALGKQEREPLSFLSERELRVFRLLGDGLTTKEIAKKLYISVSTIDSYKANIKSKLNLKNINQLISSAAKWSSFANE